MKPTKRRKNFPFSPEAIVFTTGFAELKKINKIRTRGEDSTKETLDMQLATMDNLKRALRKAEDQQINKLGRLLPFSLPNLPEVPRPFVWFFWNCLGHYGIIP